MSFNTLDTEKMLAMKSVDIKFRILCVYRVFVQSKLNFSTRLKVNSRIKI